MKRVRLIQVPVSLLFLAVLFYFGSRWFTSLEPPSSIIGTEEHITPQDAKQAAIKKESPFPDRDPWSVYHNKIVDLTIDTFRKAGAPMTPERQADVRAQLAAHHEALRASGEPVPAVPKSLKVIKKVSSSRGKLHEGPQTVEAIMETFDAMHSETSPLAEVDRKYPRAEWVQRCLDRGVVFEDYGDYSGFLSTRHEVIDYENDPNSELKMGMKKYYGLPPDASLEEYTRAAIDGTRRDLIAMREAAEEDSTVSGGFGTPNGFIPMREGVLYVKVDEKNFEANFYGDPISEKEEQALLFEGIAPEGLEVIYLGEDNKPLPPDVKPRFDWANYDVSDEVWGEMAQNMSDADWEAMGIGREIFLEIREARKEAQTTAKPVEQRHAEALESVIQNDVEMAADLEKQLMPKLPTAESIEGQLREGLSQERFDKAQQLIDQYGTEEGLRQLRKTDPEVARQFEGERSGTSQPYRDSERSQDDDVPPTQ